MTGIRFRFISVVLGCAIAACLALLRASPAHAQGYVCPQGPRPGERQVGVSGGGNGVAAVPICVRDAPAAPPPPPIRAVDSYIAAAWHKESNDAWIAAGYLNAGRARQTALDACNRAMGGGCTIASENVNGTIVIARGTYGSLYASTGGAKGPTEKQAREYCRKQNDECLIVNTVWATPGSAPVGASVAENGQVYGPKENYKRLYGAVVGLDGAKAPQGTWHSGMWIAGGFASEAEARDKALAACTKDSKGGCTVYTVLPDVFVAFAVTPEQKTYYASGPTTEIAEQRATAVCKQDKGKCRKGGWVNLAYAGQFRFDPMADGMSWFTAQAWVKGAAAPWRNTVWSVSGAKDDKSAKDAALAACRKEAKEQCDVASWSFNSKVALYVDQSGITRLLWIYQNEDPAALVRKACDDAKLTCKLVQVVDSRVAKAERIEVK